MNALNAWPVTILALPLLGAFATMVAPRRAHAIGLITSSALFAGAASLVTVVWTHGPVRVALGGWSAPLGIELRADGLAAVMVMLTSVIAGVLALSARAYFSPERLRVFWPLWLFLHVGLLALFVSGDAFNVYVTLEVISLSAVALVALSGGAAARAAAFRYLMVSLAASLMYLLGVALLYSALGVLDMRALSALFQVTPATTLAAALITGALLLKGAAFPLHFWLPAAHGTAPAPVSAALSALVVKASAYVLLRLWIEVFPAGVWPHMMTAIGVLGGLAVLWGGVQALRAERLKYVVAYSTIAQLGYIGAVFPLVRLEGAGGTAWAALTLFFVAHACAKAALFASAGAIQRALGHDQIARLSEAGRALPMAFVGLALAAISLIGLPPSGGFSAKWLMLQSALTHGRWDVVAVLVVGSLLASAYLFRVIQPAFAANAPVGARPDGGAHALARAGVVLSAVAIMLGFFSEPFLRLVTSGAATVAGRL
jgi:formate hydrogenlyase subunit 3/multisubunit Na+/H+ antiporter MnhD subunit